MTARIEAPWLREPALQHVLALLESGGREEARVVGGAVRNELMGRPITDVDIATTAKPDRVIELAREAGIKAVPTGVEHGTVTLVVDGRPFEVTTLREDHDTDGRHARVVFGRDWQRDAERRDFTINALTCERDGTVHDLVGGVDDIRTGTLRFIGDAGARIEEDYLRILRFFRFFAWYGSGRPDADGLRAASRLKDGLARLSAERVWSELRKLLGAPDPSRALLWMRQAGVLTAVLPESERWGIDAVHGLAAAERAGGWAADPLLRLAAIVPPDPARMRELANRLKLANRDRDRLLAWAIAEPVAAEASDGDLRRSLYYGDRQAAEDRLRLALAATHGPASAPDLTARLRLGALLGTAETFQRPKLPVTGADLAERGIAAGPQMGAALKRLETAWVDSGFMLGRDALLARL